MTDNKKILIGMSGGVDSAYSALLLKEKGYEVIGALLQFSDDTEKEGAERACRETGIQLIIKDVRDLFQKYVIDDFAKTYLLGGTPNPCTFCNMFVKMKALMEIAKENGCDFYSTGHYVSKKRFENGRYSIGMAQDTSKDQSYMLWGLTQEEIKTYLPVLDGTYKSDLKDKAERIGISASKAKESQDICFIKDGNYVDYIEKRYGKTRPGDFVDINGKKIGTHKGILNYTVGQRRGLDISLGYRAYVTDIDPVKNTVTLADKSACGKDVFTVSGINFQKREYPDGSEDDLLVKIRYSAKPEKAHVIFENGKAKVILENKNLLPAPGQSAVFYEDADIVFGGIIER